MITKAIDNVERLTPKNETERTSFDMPHLIVEEFYRSEFYLKHKTEIGITGSHTKS